MQFIYGEYYNKTKDISSFFLFLQGYISYSKKMNENEEKKEQKRKKNERKRKKKKWTKTNKKMNENENRIMFLILMKNSVLINLHDDR